MFFEIKNLVVKYGKSSALKGISLEVNKDEIVTLIGSNGAGKTTTLKAISGIVRPGSGEIIFINKRIEKTSPHEILRLGIAQIPEGRRTFSTMSVLENMEMGAYSRKNKREIKRDLEHMYEYFPILGTRRKQHAGSLSGGEQQMLAIARALMSSPKLLLMDEPSLGLAPVLVREVGNIIKNINRDGMSIILVEQNARMALRVAHRAYVLEVGQIALKGDAKDLLYDEHVKKAYLGG